MPRAASLAASTSTASRLCLGNCDVTTSSEPDHALAAVLARKQSDQRFGRVLQSIDDVFLHLQLAGLDPALQVGECARTVLHVVHHDKRSEEHTSELQSRQYLVCRLLLEKKKQTKTKHRI